MRLALSKLQKEKLCLKSQKDVLALSPEDVLYSKNNEQDIVFEKYKDYNLLSAMEKAYNGLPLVKKKIGQMTEVEFSKWLGAADFCKPKKKYKIKVPDVVHY